VAGPFPGMDPYIESSRFGKGFHGSLICEIVADLNAGLPEGFSANAEERVYIAPWDRAWVPDLQVVSVVRETPEDRTQTAVLEQPTDHGTVIAHPEEERELFIEIRAGADWEQLVTVIEVLSPSDKRAGDPGRGAYVTKQRDYLESQTNLVEIDLLRGGSHTVAPPRNQLQVFGAWDYVITAHRPARRWHFEFWLNRLPQPLPAIKVPLVEGIAPFELNLQSVVDRAYDKGPYRRRVDYRQDPPVAFDEATAAWIDSWLRERGLRSEPTTTE